MDQELLVNNLIEAGADFVRDFDNYVPVSVAFWVKPTESDHWYLYIASDDIDDANQPEAYREVMRRLDAFPAFDPFRIKLVNSSEPVALDAVRFRDRGATDIPVIYNGTSLGGLSIESTYIYPGSLKIKVGS